MQRSETEMNIMNKELARSIGSVAREARKALQLTQEDAAERINVSVEFYARIERGNSLPSIDTFARIVSALCVSADALLGNRPSIAQPPGVPVTWTSAPPSDSPELRRLTRRLRKARPATLRLVNMLVKELESSASNDQVARAEAPPAPEHDEPSGGSLPSSQRGPYVQESAAAG